MEKVASKFRYVKTDCSDTDLLGLKYVTLTQFGVLQGLRMLAEFRTGVWRGSLKELSKLFGTGRTSLFRHLEALASMKLILPLTDPVNGKLSIMVDEFQVTDGPHKNQWTSVELSVEAGNVWTYSPDRKTWREREKTCLEALAALQQANREEDPEDDDDDSDEGGSFPRGGSFVTGGCPICDMGVSHLSTRGESFGTGGVSFGTPGCHICDTIYKEVEDVELTKNFVEQPQKQKAGGPDYRPVSPKRKSQVKSQVKTRFNALKSPVPQVASSGAPRKAKTGQPAQAKAQPETAPAQPDIPEPEITIVHGVEVLKDESLSIYARYHRLREMRRPRYRTTVEFQIPPGVNAVDDDPDWDRLRQVAEHAYNVDGGASGRLQAYTRYLAPLLKLPDPAYMLKKMISWHWEKTKFYRAGNCPMALLASNPVAAMSQYINGRNMMPEDYDEEHEDYYLRATDDGENSLMRDNPLGRRASQGLYTDPRNNMDFEFDFCRDEINDKRHWCDRYPRELVPLLFDEKYTAWYDDPKNGQVDQTDQTQPNEEIQND
jgi:hypothetical protein